MTTTYGILTALITAFLCLHTARGKPTAIEIKQPPSIKGIFDKTPTVPELIIKNGYPCEVHTVVTKDNYILTLHRIPHGKRGPNHWYESSPPVLFQHGVLSSSASWVLNTPDKAPGYVFADRGYDVWLTNIRGNVYSRKHKTLNPSESEFWKFSWDEMALYDIPAFIDYILKTTRYRKLYYIGHSMGTTIFFAGMSVQPEYNNKIKLAFNLAPVGTVGHIETPLKYFAYIRNEISFVMRILGRYEFLAEDSYALDLLRPLCNMMQITELVCGNMLFFITGFDNHELNSTMFPLITKEMLSGTSLYTVLHFAQEYASGNFEKYDYGIIGNYERYGSFDPPKYDLSKVTAPIVLMYGENDYLADPTDVQFLSKKLPNVRALWKVDYKNFNHLDFLWAIDVYRLVYSRVLRYMAFF